MILLAVGYALTFAIPLLLAYLVQTHWDGLGVKGARGGSAYTFGAWLSASRHGIPPHFGTAQLLRAAVGWPQSLFSLGDLGLKLRLWRLRETSFPVPSRSLVLVAFPFRGRVVIGVIAPAYRRLKATDRGFRRLPPPRSLAIWCSQPSWQGTDLERYFPSLLLSVTAARPDDQAHRETPGALGLPGASDAVPHGCCGLNWHGNVRAGPVPGLAATDVVTGAASHESVEGFACRVWTTNVRDYIAARSQYAEN
jgi:hypothetical protein